MKNRYFGIIPLFTFIYASVVCLIEGEAGRILWICNISTLIQGVGMLWHRTRWVWIGTMWLIIGLPLWAVDGLLHDLVFTPQAIMMHVGCSLLGLAFLWREESVRNSWWQAYVILLILYAPSRLFVDPALNVNLSSSIHPMSAGLFSNYNQYFIITNISFIISLYLVDVLIKHLLARKEVT